MERRKTVAEVVCKELSFRKIPELIDDLPYGDMLLWFGI